MTLRRDALAALALFVLFAAYGFEALHIEVFPGQEQEPFKPRTMPIALAIAGIVLCVIRLLQTMRVADTGAAPRSSYNWQRAAFLCLAMLGYGYLLTPLGFVVATSLFLAAGFFTMGERGRIRLLVVPIAFAVAFHLLMSRLPGLYLAPGTWWPGGG